MDWLIDPKLWASLITLTAVEIILGIDNLVFIAILAGRLPSSSKTGHGHSDWRCHWSPAWRCWARSPG